MLRFKFGKLVRDKIVEHQIKSGAKPKYRILSPAEHQKCLIEKLIEEAREILVASPEDRAAEIADVQQALNDLKEVLGIDEELVSTEMIKKNEKNGAFKKGIYIESVELGEGDQWGAYYRQNPDRYPEIK